MLRRKVLIVDDEPDIVETIKYSLEYENIECVVANDGEEALIKARKERPDLIILDIMLPKINGYKVARLLKFDQSSKGIHIIMLTARTQEKDLKLGRETGADEYVTKPFDIDRLTALVKKYLAVAAGRREIVWEAQPHPQSVNQTAGRNPYPERP